MFRVEFPMLTIIFIVFSENWTQIMMFNAAKDKSLIHTEIWRLYTILRFQS